MRVNSRLGWRASLDASPASLWLSAYHASPPLGCVPLGLAGSPVVAHLGPPGLGVAGGLPHRAPGSRWRRFLWPVESSQVSGWTPSFPPSRGALSIAPLARGRGATRGSGQPKVAQLEVLQSTGVQLLKSARNWRRGRSTGCSACRVVATHQFWAGSGCSVACVRRPYVHDLPPPLLACCLASSTAPVPVLVPSLLLIRSACPAHGVPRRPGPGRWAGATLPLPGMRQPPCPWPARGRRPLQRPPCGGGCQTGSSVCPSLLGGPREGDQLWGFPLC